MAVGLSLALLLLEVAVQLQATRHWSLAAAASVSSSSLSSSVVEDRRPRLDETPTSTASREASAKAAEVLAYERRCRHANLTPPQAPIDHTPAPFLIDASAACAGDVFLLVVVQSAVPHRSRRDLIRRTWASVANIQGDRIATVFFVGRSESPTETRRLRQEADSKADIVQADFRDTYRNLTYKHLYAIKWVTQRCRSVRFVMKVDDDIVLNVFHLHLIMRDRLVHMRNFLYCQVKRLKPFRRRRSKWFVSKEEWPLDHYPRYCKGMGYLMSAELMHSMHLCAKWRKYFWVDDVFVTGALTEALGVKLIQWEDGWDAKPIHPAFAGPAADTVIMVREPYNMVMPQLHERVWDAMLRYSRGA